MSGFYYVLQRLGTVSLIKQIILEGNATGKRRRKTGENVSLPLILIKKKNGQQTNHSHTNTRARAHAHAHTYPSVCVCACARVYAHACAQPSYRQQTWKYPPVFPVSWKPTRPSCCEETQVQTIVMKLVDADSQPPSDLWVPSSTSSQYYSPPNIKARRGRTVQGEAPILGCLLSEQSFHSPLLKNTRTAAPTIASESQPETLEAFCFSPVACPKAWPSLPLPAALHCLAFQGLDWLLPPDAEEIL